MGGAAWPRTPGTGLTGLAASAARTIALGDQLHSASIPGEPVKIHRDSVQRLLLNPRSADGRLLVDRIRVAARIGSIPPRYEPADLVDGQPCLTTGRLPAGRYVLEVERDGVVVRAGSLHLR